MAFIIALALFAYAAHIAVNKAPLMLLATAGSP